MAVAFVKTDQVGGLTLLTYSGANAATTLSITTALKFCCMAQAVSQGTAVSAQPTFTPSTGVVAFTGITNPSTLDVLIMGW